jgi:hypothetical protein
MDEVRYLTSLFFQQKKVEVTKNGESLKEGSVKWAQLSKAQNIAQ